MNCNHAIANSLLKKKISRSRSPSRSSKSIKRIVKKTSPSCSLETSASKPTKRTVKKTSRSRSPSRSSVKPTRTVKKTTKCNTKNPKSVKNTLITGVESAAKSAINDALKTKYINNTISCAPLSLSKKINTEIRNEVKNVIKNTLRTAASSENIPSLKKPDVKRSTVKKSTVKKSTVKKPVRKSTKKSV